MHARAAVKRAPAKRTSAKRRSGKRELIDTGTDKRYVRRDGTLLWGRVAVSVVRRSEVNSAIGTGSERGE